MSLAAVQLELLSESHWWIAIGAVTGIALLVYAVMLRRQAAGVIACAGRAEGIGRWPLSAATAAAGLLGILLTAALAAYCQAHAAEIERAGLARWSSLSLSCCLLAAAVFLFCIAASTAP